MKTYKIVEIGVAHIKNKTAAAHNVIPQATPVGKSFCHSSTVLD
jgi:hypothetical protein